MIKRFNPMNWIIKAMDATDRWVERMSYQGHHWVTA